MRLPHLIAHRGASGYAPENTMAAFKKAHAMGAKWVELDVRFTRDGEIVVFHDRGLQRTTNGKGLLVNTTYATLSRLDAGSWFAENYAQERVPKLIQILDYCYANQMGINIEIKSPGTVAKRMAKQLLVLLSRHWGENFSNLLISSSVLTNLQALRALAPRLQLAYITHKWPKNWQRKLSQLGCVSFHVKHKVLTSARVKSIKANGYKVLVFTVNRAELAQKLFNWGVDAVFSDYPDLL